MKLHLRLLLLIGLLGGLSSFAGFARPVLAATEITTQAPCVNGGGYCVFFDSNASTIPVIRSFTFNAPRKGTAAVSFHGSLYCGNTVNTVQVIDLVSQIVTRSTATPSASGPGGLRQAVVLTQAPIQGSRDSFNLASTRVFPISGAGSRTYHFKIEKLRMDNYSYCYVYNAAFTVVFAP
jgi:hypothetical protein